ncbi:hypothetical protein [Akkermansia muciniphila]|nr:hypothetical protein [Akkermansia muciniphila]WMB15183.1 hypothetical protein O4G22_10925 [Akkermansia muciniphila]
MAAHVAIMVLCCIIRGEKYGNNIFIFSKGIFNTRKEMERYVQRMTKSVKYSARYYIVQGHFSQGKLYCFHKSQIDLNGSLPVLRQARSRGMAFAKLPMPRIPFPALSLTGASGVGRV